MKIVIAKYKLMHKVLQIHLCIYYLADSFVDHDHGRAEPSRFFLSFRYYAQTKFIRLNIGCGL